MARLTFANVTSAIALFVALGGTAYAVNTIGSSDVIDESLLSQDIKNREVGTNDLAIGSVFGSRIRDDGVLSSHIVDNGLTASDLGPASVTPSELDLIGFAEVSAQEITTSGTFTNLATPGPNVTVTVPNSGLVAILSSVEMHRGGAGAATVGLFEPTDLNPTRQISESINPSFETRASIPDQDEVGITGSSIGGWRVYQATPGVRTFRLRYKSSGGNIATFSNRKLWVMAIR